ncbi:MAG: S8 family serine peptidase, partial [Candidatus Zixiibacteriota bacterium]
MRHHLICQHTKNICLSLMLIVFSFSVGFSQISDETAYKEGEFIIQLSEYSDPASLESSFLQYNLVNKKLLSRRMNIWLFEYDYTNMKPADHESLLSQVKYNDDVLIAQFNHYVKERASFPNDQYFNNQWDMHNTGQSGGVPDADIDGPEAWDLSIGGTTAQGDEIVSAVIDGGAYLNHVDLDFWKNINEIPNNGIDDDGNGYIDDYDGWNAYNSNGNIPSSSHGTHVSGTVGAIGNNNTGVTGVNWNVKVMPIAGSSGTESVVVEAYGYVFEMRTIYNETDGALGAFVVSTNSSFGVDYGNPDNYPIWCAMYDSMGSVGILSAAATANININIDVAGDVPTACPSDYMIAVTNTTDDDVKNSGAAYGLTTIDLGAPGTNIYSTTPNNNYGYMTGTSMATPHVTGAVALLYAAACPGFIQGYKNDPGTYALLIKQFILDGTDLLPSLDGITVSGGRLNIFNSIVLLQAYQCGTTIEHTPLTD